MSLRTWQAIAIALQAFQVAHLLFHDWVPLGPLNDLAGVRQVNTRVQLLAGTLITGIPTAYGLWRSIVHFGSPYPHGLKITLWLIYGILFVGELQAWWLPYFFGSSNERIERYRVMFGRTHAFLAPRHGIVINTLHCLLHAATFATLVVLTQL